MRLPSLLQPEVHRARKKTEKEKRKRGKKTNEEREETTTGVAEGRRERKKTAFSRAPEVACTCRCDCFAQFLTRNRNLEHVRSMICAVQSL